MSYYESAEGYKCSKERAMFELVKHNANWDEFVADNAGVAVSCHSLPKQWFDGASRDIVKTGGNEYKKI